MNCFHQGVLVRPAGDNLVLCPPFIVQAAEIDRMVEVLASAITQQA
jgi:beta-alanine--pyruvate transaminase